MVNKFFIVVIFCMFSLSINAQQVFKKEIDRTTSLKIVVVPFDKDAHKINYCDTAVCAIDGATFFGSDGGMPTQQISEIIFSFKDADVSLEVGSMFQPSLNDSNLEYKLKVKPYWGGRYKVTGRFSDGAGGYIAHWVVSRHGSVRTLLMDYEMFFDLYSEINK